MGIKVTNNAFGVLASGITDGDTVITLASGDGVKFPSLGVNDYFFGTLIDSGNNLEIVKVTARAVDTLTVVRGQDNTTARAYTAGDRFELRPTAAMFLAFTQAEGIAYDNTTSGLAATDAQAAIDELEAEKQENLISGGNIKTINGSTLLGAGDIIVGLGGGSGEVFTANGVFTVPDGITKIKVIVVGGGGGGGSATTSTASNGGGAGGVAVKYITTTPGTQYSVTVGGGGGAAAAGGTSSFGSECSATGGSGGTTSRPLATRPTQTAGGTGSNGTYNFPTGLGKRDTMTVVNTTGYTISFSGYWYGQDGADSLFGRGGVGAQTDAAGGAAVGYGAGGGGAYQTGATARSGGAGAPGIVIVEW